MRGTIRHTSSQVAERSASADADDLTLSAQQAVAVGIIATEFISHAVPERGDTAEGAPIVVSLRHVAQQRMRLEVSGSGFPPLQNLDGEFTSSIVGGRIVLAVETPYSLTAALS
jgi:hypothetical protein